MDIQKDVHLFVGGPVEPHRAWVLTAHRELDDRHSRSWTACYLSAAPELIRLALAELRRIRACASSSAMPGGDRASSTTSWRHPRG